MILLAETLSSDIPHVRVDMYLSSGRIYFWEMALYHNSGLRKFEPYEYDLIWGNGSNYLIRLYKMGQNKASGYIWCKSVWKIYS